MKIRNELWLSSAIELVNKSIDISKTDYKLLVCAFYEFISNKNLAKLISILYKMDTSEVYLKIDNIIRKGIVETSEFQDVMGKLNENGLLNWLEENAD